MSKMLVCSEHPQNVRRPAPLFAPAPPLPLLAPPLPPRQRFFSPTFFVRQVLFASFFSPGFFRQVFFRQGGGRGGRYGGRGVAGCNTDEEIWNTKSGRSKFPGPHA